MIQLGARIQDATSRGTQGQLRYPQLCLSPQNQPWPRANSAPCQAKFKDKSGVHYAA
jgi:hypothetical protein